MIENLLYFDEILARDVMTPRTVMKVASEDTPIKEFLKRTDPCDFLGFHCTKTVWITLPVSF